MLSGDDRAMQLLDALLRAGSPLLDHAVPRSELDELERRGCRWRTDVAAGWQLAEAGLEVWADYLRWRLGPGPAIEVYRQVGSTQDAVRRQLASGAAGAIAAADQQSAGRGRLGRSWAGGPGQSVLVSIGTRCVGTSGLQAVNRLTLTAAVAVAEAIEQVAGPPALRVAIKWPNDLLVGQAKVAGILVETLLQPNGGAAAIIGVGVNVHQQANDWPGDWFQWRTRPTSLAAQGRSVHRLALLAAIAQLVKPIFTENDSRHALEQWHRRSVLLDQPVHLIHDGREIRGQVVDLDPDLGLVVRSTDGLIHHLPAATTTPA